MTELLGPKAEDTRPTKSPWCLVVATLRGQELSAARAGRYSCTVSKSTRAQALSQLVWVARPSRLAEFGSWEGASAITFLEAARKIELDLKLVCVDTWLGSPEHWNNSFPNSEWSFERLGVVGGEPSVITTFRKALRSRKLLDKVEIVRAPTSHAVGYIATRFPPIDMVYVDADHSYHAVTGDLQAARRITGPNGLISGDDWAWISVRLAVARFCLGARAILVSPDTTTYVLLPRGRDRIASEFQNLGWRQKSPGAIILVGWVRPALRRTRKSLRRLIDRLYTLATRPPVSKKFP